VREDARRAIIREETEAAIADIVEAYDVRVVYEPSKAPGAEAQSAAKQ